jgi:sugar/nucleoside kinase (ribokinase family)
VPHAEIAASKVFFTTAYIWDTPNQIAAIESAIDTARETGCRLAIDLADPFAVGRSRETILEHFEKGFDVVFANAEEGRIMTGLGCEDAARKLAETIRIAVVTNGADGAYIVSGTSEVHVPAERVEVVDTTGAGDCFAAGFLHGLLHDLPLEACGRIATCLAADTITHMGVRLSDDVARRVRELSAGVTDQAE